MSDVDPMKPVKVFIDTVQATGKSTMVISVDGEEGFKLNFDTKDIDKATALVEKIYNLECHKEIAEEVVSLMEALEGPTYGQAVRDDKLCNLLGLNPYAVNEGLASSNDRVSLANTSLYHRVKNMTGRD